MVFSQVFFECYKKKKKYFSISKKFINHKKHMCGQPSPYHFPNLRYPNLKFLSQINFGTQCKKSANNSKQDLKYQ